MNTIDMTGNGAMLTARDDYLSVVNLTRDLVRIPSRGGIDPYEPVLDHLSKWMNAHHLAPALLRDDTGAVVALTCEIRGGRPGPRWVLDACLDTAPFGDERAWTHPPTSAVIRDGWLWGRGSADSKSGAAIFCHIAARVAAVTDQLRGSLVLLFDVDEHTGGFGGAKRYFEGPGAPDDVAGVLIGYPGINNLVTGGRGVHRAQLHVYGVSSHSGGRKATPNAVEKGAHLARALSCAGLPESMTADFPLPGKVTVTAMHGGEGYSITPDLCTLNVDIRTTPAFGSDAAGRLLEQLIADVDDAWPGTRATLIQVGTRWPAYTLSTSSPLRGAMMHAAHAAGLDVEPKIAGPSNIGNYLAGLGIPATAGFGAEYAALHATDERIRLDTVPSVQAVYHAALSRLLGP